MRYADRVGIRRTHLGATRACQAASHEHAEPGGTGLRVTRSRLLRRGDASRSASGSGHSLIIEHDYQVPPGGGGYTEGALSEVVVTVSTGASKTVRGRIESSLTVDGLSPGTYKVEPGLRPCSGNCDDKLDPRTDACEVTITIPQAKVVRVRFVATEGCQAVSG